MVGYVTDLVHFNWLTKVQDLTTYILEQRTPRLTFSEACEGSGLCYTSIIESFYAYVDRWTLRLRHGSERI